MSRLTLAKRTTRAPSHGLLQEITRGVGFFQAVVLRPERAQVAFWAVRALPALCDVVEGQRFPLMPKDMRFTRVFVQQLCEDTLFQNMAAGASLRVLGVFAPKTDFVEVRFLDTTQNVARVRFHFQALTQVPEDVLIRRFSHGRTHS